MRSFIDLIGCKPPPTLEPFTRVLSDLPESDRGGRAARRGHPREGGETPGAYRPYYRPVPPPPRPRSPRSSHRTPPRKDGGPRNVGCRPPILRDQGPRSA